MQVRNARQNLEKEIVHLSILMTEKIIKKNIQEDKNKFFVDNIITELSKIKKL